MALPMDLIIEYEYPFVSMVFIILSFYILIKLANSTNCGLCDSLIISPLGTKENGEKLDQALHSEHCLDYDKRAKLLKNLSRNLGILLGNGRHTSEIPDAANDLLNRNFFEIANLTPKEFR